MKEINIMVVDSQGGGLGKQLVSAIKKEYPKAHILAVGTNVLATSAMIKAGADEAATGENPIVVVSKKADIIIGPVGMVIAEQLYCRGCKLRYRPSDRRRNAETEGIFPGHGLLTKSVLS